MPRFSLTVALMMLAAPALAESQITVADGYAFQTAKTAMAGAGYFTLSNSGDEADTLVGVEADYPRVEVHNVEVTDGVAKMFAIESLEIPAGGTVTLAPGGFHVMFMGLKGNPLEAGQMIPVKLLFANSDPIETMLMVRERGAAKAGHGSHGGHGAASDDSSNSHSHGHSHSNHSSD